MEKRCKMSREQRAKQFAPFSALKGYEEAIKEEEMIMLEKMESIEDLQIMSNLGEYY